MNKICTTLFLLFAYSFCNAQFAVLNPELIKSKGVPLTATVNDFDGDGLKDVAYTSENPITLTVVFSESNKTFTELSLYTTTGSSISTSYALASGDLNKDGKADIILLDNALNNTEKLIVFISNGRTFEQRKFSTPTASTFSNKIEVLDWDGDTNPDFVLLSDSDPLQFYKGNGSGQFSRQSISTIGSGVDMEIADLNNDSKQDVVISNQNKVSVYLSANSSYNKTDFNVTISISEIAIGDLSEDGLKDILLVNFGGSSSDNLVLLKNSNTSIFTQSNITSPGTLLRGLDIADLNADGRMDILAGRFNNENGAYVMLNSGGLNFTEMTIKNNYSSLIQYVKATDIDNDSKLEIIALSAGRRLDVFKLNNNNEYDFYSTHITGFHTGHGVYEDLNKDGYPDLVAASLSNNAVAILYGKSNQTFEKPIYFTGTGPINAVGLKDINNDGYPDIFCSSAFTSYSAGMVIKSNGAGGFLAPQIFNPPFGGVNLVIADLNNDGLEDVIYANAYLQAKPDGSYIQKVFNCPIGMLDLSVGDINNDSFPDIVITDYMTVVYFINDGAGNFPSYTILKDTTPSYKITIADIDGDGKSDFIVPADNGEVSIYYAQSGGTYNLVKLSTSGYRAFNSAAADFNNDNKADLAVAHDDGTIDFFIQKENNQFTRTTVKSNGPNHMIVADVNNDSKQDLITFSLNNEPLAILYNDAVFEPTLTSSNLAISNRTDVSATVSLTKGNGNGRIILVREVGNSVATPNDGTFYSFNNTFGAGAQLGTKNYAVYRGSDQSVNITGLKEDTEYIVTAFEYSSNKANTIINYETSGAQIQFKTKKNQTITAATINSKTIGDAPFALTFSASSGLPVGVTLVTNNVSLSGNNLTLLSAGPVKIKFNQPGDDNYGPAPEVEMTFCVNPITPTITYASTANGKYTLTSSATNNNIWLKNNAAIPGATSQTVEVTPDASYTVKVDYSGCSNTSLPVANQTINFPALTTKEEGQPDFLLNATANSSLPVSYEVVSGGVSIANSTVKINSPGPAKIKATQTGNSGFFPANAVEQTFCVNPKIPTVTITTSGPGQLTLSSSSDINNNWLKNGVAISGALSKTYEPKEDGIYAVKVDYSGCTNTSAPTANLITGIEEMINSVSIYPNPSNGVVTIEWPNQSIKIHKLTLLDSQGKGNLVKYEVNGNYVQFNVSDFPAGIYLLNVHSDKGLLPIKVMKN